MSRDNKSSTLWNMLDPDDPYDIKKSMIAKLPDHPPQPMGRHLELVCLLQAAEIQRLSDYLTEIKSKYREVERRELDRHSYEIQIKELAEKNISLNSMRTENDRLKDFIKRQSFELEELQKKNIASVNFETLQAKYEGLLNELRLARGQNENAEKTIARMNVEINQWRIRCEKYEQQKSMMNSQFEVQMRERISTEIKIVREKSEQRFQRLQVDYRRLSQSLQSKNQEILILQGHKQQLLKELKMLQQKNRSKGNIEQAMNQKNRQLQRISISLSQKTSKLEQSMSSNQKLGGELNILQQRYRNMERDRERLLIRIKQLQGQVIKNESFERMEDKVVMMSMEIQRLNALLATRAKECAEANGEIERLKFQLRNNAGSKEILQRQRQRIAKLQGEIQMLRVNQNRLRIATDQLERIKQVLNTKNEQYYLLQQKFSSVQVTTVEITNLTKQKSRLQQQLSSAQQKIQNLKANLNLNQASAIDLAKMAKDKSILEQQLQSCKSELRSYKTSVQSQISMLRGQNQRLRQQLQQISQFKGQTQKYRIQLQRNRNQSNQLKGEIMNLRRASQQQRSFRQKLQSQKNSLMSSNQEMLSELLNLKKQIESLKLMAKSFDQKQRAIHSLELDIRNLQANFSGLEQEYMVSEQKNEKLQVTIKSIYEEISRLHSVLSTKTNQCQKLSRDISQLEERCRFYETKMSNHQGEKQFYENQIRRLKGQLQSISKTSVQANKEISMRRNQMIIEKQKIEKIIVQKQTLILEYRKQKQTLQRQLVQIQRQQATRISTEQQLRNQRQQLIQIRQRILQDLRSKDNLIAQLQKSISDRESDTKQSDNKIRLWESRINQWENRMKDTEKTIRMKEQQISRLREQKDRIINELQKVNGDLQESNRVRQMIIIQNNQIKKKIDEILSDQRGRNNEQQLRNQIKLAQQALFRQRRQSQSLKSKCKNLEQLLSTQSREIQQSRETVREYQMKIIHIQNTQSRIIQQRCRQYEVKLQQKDSLIINLQKQVNQMQSQLRVILTRDQDTVNNLRNYEDKVSLLSVEIERLNIKIQDKNRECREKDLIIQRGNQTDSATIDKIRQYESKLSFYSLQFQKLTAQINRKDQEISQKHNYIQQLTQKINQSTYTQAGKANISQYQIEIKNLKVALEQYENINLHTAAQRDELFQVSHQLKEQLDQAHSQFAEAEKQLRSQIAYKSEQNRRFGEQLGQLKRRQQSLLLKIQQYQRLSRNLQEDKSLKMRISQLQLRLQSLSKQNQQISIHNLNLKQQVSQLLLINQQINIKLIDGGNNSKEELSRLSIRIKQYSSIIQSKDQQLSGWDMKYNQLYAAYEELYTNYQVTKGEYEKTIANIKVYESKLFKIEQVYQSIGVVLRGKQKQIYDLKVRLKGDGDLYEKNLILSKEIDRLTILLQNSQLQVRELRLSMTDNLSLHKRIEEQLALMVVLFAEIESLRSRLVLTERQCEEVRRSSIVPCRVDKNKENRL